MGHGGDRARVGRSRVALALKAGSLLMVTVLLLLSACAGDSGDQIASVEDWKLTPEMLEPAYDRVYGPGSFAIATYDERSRFVELLIDKEVMLRIAREACPEPDILRQKRVRAGTEELVLNEFIRFERFEAKAFVKADCFFENNGGLKGNAFVPETFGIFDCGLHHLPSKPPAAIVRPQCHSAKLAGPLIHGIKGERADDCSVIVAEHIECTALE